MPWKEINKMDQRKQFVLRALKGERMTDLCEEYGISRPTGYKFLARFKENGFEGLRDASRKPRNSPNQTDAFLVQLILSTKGRFSSWGPKKIKARLHKEYPHLKIPAASTIGGILSRNGLVETKTRRIRRGYLPAHLTRGTAANEVWCIDYKGQFKTKDNMYCYPLTVSDDASRFLLACEALPSTNKDFAYQTLKSVFQRYGLPCIIRSDNGSPFASSSHVYGLSKLSVWLLSLGIKLERIEPGHPEQNGRHERMHRTLKRDAIRPPADNLLQQQEVFDRYIKEYNYERPHEALGMKTPSELYRQNPRRYSKVEPKYPNHDLTRSVDSNGRITLTNYDSVRISKAFDGHTLGLKEQEKSWIVSFFDYDVGIIDKNSLTFESMEILDN